MEYQIGQAVISKNNDKLYLIHKIEVAGSFNYIYLNRLDGFNLPMPCYNNEICHATEAEILDHIQQHGWVMSNALNIDSPSGNVYLQRARQDYIWEIHHVSHVNNYEEFGKECLTANRIAKALNLAN